MPKKIQSPQAYKTETQLKEEARARQAAEVEASAAVHKSVLQKKAENYWYHYKWFTIAGVFIALILIFFIRDMFFRTRPDTTVVIVNASYIGEYERSYMTSVLEKHATDYNGDKKIMIGSDAISIPSIVSKPAQSDSTAPDFSGGQEEMANMMKLMAVLAAGTEMIYLLDDDAYNYIVERAQGEDSSETGNYFSEFSVPAEKLGGEAADLFSGMRFYLRATRGDEDLYEYCKQILESLN